MQLWRWTRQEPLDIFLNSIEDTILDQDQAWVFPLGILGIVVSVLMLVPASLVTVVCSAGCSSRLLRGGPHKCRGVELFEESLLAIYYLTRYCVASRIVPLVSLIS